MSDIHKNFFGQMPPQKREINGKLYRKLEIGEVIEDGDHWEMKSPLSYTDTEWFVRLKEIMDNPLTIIGQRYNPNREHKHLIIWRKI